MTRRNSVSSGQRLTIPADEYSDLLRQGNKIRMFGRNFTGGTVDELFPPLVVWIKNTTASKVSAYGVLGIDSPITSPGSSDTSPSTVSFRQVIRFKGVSPSTSTPHYGKFAVLQEPAAAGRTVRACIGGVCLAKLNIQDADDVACDISNGVTSYLDTQQHGAARILWKESGTGAGKWGLIHIGSWANIMLGKTDAAISKGASGTVSIWSGAIGSEADTGVNVTAYNRFANVAITKWVLVVSIQGRLYLAAAEC